MWSASRSVAFMARTESQLIVQAAKRLSTAAAARTPCAPVRDLIGRNDIDAAYRIQSYNIETLVRAGRSVAGRKIGLTSPAVQRQLGVDQPDFGVLLDDFDVSSQTTVDSTRLLQPRIEAEVAFVLSADIDTEIAIDECPTYVSELFASFEIVDSRIAGWDISLADTVADNASSGLYVLGDSVPCSSAPDLEQITMTMTANGENVSAGRGSDCLGSPWAALAWLANTSLSYGAPLQARDVILSGALGPMVPVRPGSTYTALISGIGEVSATFRNMKEDDDG